MQYLWRAQWERDEVPDRDIACSQAQRAHVLRHCTFRPGSEAEERRWRMSTCSHDRTRVTHAHLGQT